MTDSIQFFSVIFWLFLIGTAVYLFYKSYSQSDEEDVNYFEAALKNIVDGAPRLAIDNLKEAIRKDSSNVDAYTLLGNVLRKEGAYNQALKVHKDLPLRTDLSQEQRKNIHLALAKDLLALKKEDHALPHLKAVLKFSTKDTFVTTNLLRIYEKQHKFADAFALLNENSALTENRAIRLSMYKVLEGLEKVEDNKEKDARILFKEALKLEPKNEAAYILIGDSYMREEREDEAIDMWVKTAQEIPEKAHFVFERLEKGWFESGEFFKLEEFYRSLVQKKKKSGKAVIALAEILAKKGETEEALDLCRSYLSETESPDNTVHVFYLHTLLSAKQTKGVAGEVLSFLDASYLSKLELFICTVCKHESDEPHIKCPSCNSWNSFT